MTHTHAQLGRNVADIRAVCHYLYLEYFSLCKPILVLNAKLLRKFSEILSAKFTCGTCVHNYVDFRIIFDQYCRSGSHLNSLCSNDRHGDLETIYSYLLTKPLQFQQHIIALHFLSRIVLSDNNKRPSSSSPFSSCEDPICYDTTNAPWEYVP